MVLDMLYLVVDKFLLELWCWHKIWSLYVAVFGVLVGCLIGFMMTDFEGMLHKF